MASTITYPYGILFEGKRFDYYSCNACGSVYVNPVPDEQTLVRMYSRSTYHDCHYAEQGSRSYLEAARLLREYAPAGAAVMDYGCGLGDFLKAARSEGFSPFGVEFDAEAAQFASSQVDCEVISVHEFQVKSALMCFDVIHLGDVLEHLPDPADTLKKLLRYLKRGGLLFAEGPLEINPSPVYWAARLFGAAKHLLRPGFVGAGQPTHLYRTGARQQLAFFQRVDAELVQQHWRIYETGWPYASGGAIKRAIANLALQLGGRRALSVCFGNRFQGIFTYQPTTAREALSMPSHCSAPSGAGAATNSGILS